MITYKSSNFYERQSGSITVSTPKDFLISLFLYQLYYFSDFNGGNGISRYQEIQTARFGYYFSVVIVSLSTIYYLMVIATAQYPAWIQVTIFF